MVWPMGGALSCSLNRAQCGKILCKISLFCTYFKIIRAFWNDKGLLYGVLNFF